MVQELEIIFRRIESQTPTNCVIASLESAFHAPATSEERKLRDKLAREKEEALKPFLHLAETPEGHLALYRANLILETRSVTALFKRITSQNTPLGKALRKHEMQQRVITGGELDQVIVHGCVILIARTTLNNDEWHMMHARRIDGGLIVSGNDNNEPITLEADKKYLVYQFTRKDS